MRSGDLLVTTPDHSLPYTLEDFLTLLGETSSLRGLVVIDFPAGATRLPLIKCRLMKTSEGLKLTDETRVLEVKTLQEFMAQVSVRFKLGVFGRDRGSLT